jgi:hypothetical protein
MSKSKTSKLGYLTIFLAFILLFYSIASTSVLWISPSDLGLASKLPLTYWIGLFLVSCLWYVGRESKFQLALAFLLTLSYLYIAPAFIRVPPWISNSYYPFGESKLINETGHVVYRPSTTLVSYLDWPIFLYFASALTQVTGIPDDVLLRIFPLLTVAMYGLFAILILRVKLKLSYSIFGAAWIIGSFFIRQQYFGPQAIAYIFFLMILLIVFWLFFEDRSNRRALGAVLLFLLVVTTFTHPLTSLMSLVVMLALYVSYRFVLKRPARSAFILCILSAVIWLAYNMFLAQGFFQLMVTELYDDVFAGPGGGVYSEPGRVLGSRGAMQVNFVTSWTIVLIGSLVAVISVLQVIRYLRAQHGRIRTAYIEFSLFNVVLLILLGLFAFTGQYGNTEAYQRAFMFGLIPLSFLCISLLSKKPKLFVVMLACLLFLNILAQYGGDTYRLATDSQLTGTAFFADHTSESVLLVGKFSLYIRYHDPLKNITVPSIGIRYPFTSIPSNGSLQIEVNKVLKETEYIMRSSLEDNYYLFFLGTNPFQRIDFDQVCNRVYDNGRVTIFRTMNGTGD